ncbi:MAG: hypothetical protein AB1713_08395 [Pseudomonadota bacterium]
MNKNIIRDFWLLLATSFFLLLLVSALFLLGSAGIIGGIKSLLGSSGTDFSINHFSGISDYLGLLVGIPVSIAASFVAIVLAKVALDISKREERRDAYSFLEEKSDQLTQPFIDLAAMLNKITHIGYSVGREATLLMENRRHILESIRDARMEGNHSGVKEHEIQLDMVEEEIRDLCESFFLETCKQLADIMENFQKSPAALSVIENTANTLGRNTLTLSDFYGSIYKSMGKQIRTGKQISQNEAIEKLTRCLSDAPLTEGLKESMQELKGKINLEPNRYHSDHKYVGALLFGRMLSELTITRDIRKEDFNWKAEKNKRKYLNEHEEYPYYYVDFLDPRYLEDDWDASGCVGLVEEYWSVGLWGLSVLFESIPTIDDIRSILIETYGDNNADIGHHHECLVQNEHIRKMGFHLDPRSMLTDGSTAVFRWISEKIKDDDFLIFDRDMVIHGDNY